MLYAIRDEKRYKNYLRQLQFAKRQTCASLMTNKTPVISRKQSAKAITCASRHHTTYYIYLIFLLLWTGV